MRSIKRNQAKLEKKAERAYRKLAKAANGGSKNRITHAAFYRKYCAEAGGYVYVLKATRAGEQFGINIPADGERDCYKEMLMVYHVLSTHWQWQEPDALDLIQLITQLFHKSGNPEHVQKFIQTIA